MKNFLFLGLFLLTFQFASSQSSAIKANPLGLAFGIANVGYEFSTTDSQSMTISGLYFDILDIKGVGAGLEYRFYFDKEAITGWHAGPSIGYFKLEDIFDVSASVFSIGAEIGHQWVFGEHFLLDIFGGYGFNSGGDDLSGFNTTTGTAGLSLGYAW
ncbi:MAG: DUF3575 domain-containing protein [Flavobacterium sp.]|jgi:hypothetical protein|nr:DUF3575 domain-containing protein [Flavobacterium sp.]|tara:strand:- start:242 stop:712 length:471 start_codon:yes stop_codon:yes gene_type:complete